MRSALIVCCLSIPIAALVVGCGGCGDDDWSCKCGKEPDWIAIVEVSDSAQHRLPGASLTFTVDGDEPRTVGCDDSGICTASAGPGFYEMQVQREGYLPKDVKAFLGFSTFGVITHSYVALQKRT